MRQPEATHLALPWHVHAVAHDFDLLDVWQFPIQVPGDWPIQAFLDFLAEAQAGLLSGNGPAALLFRLREGMGRVFGWDEDHSPTDRARRHSESLRHRLDGIPELSNASEPRPVREGGIGFDPLFVTQDESLAEIQNATVHALLHLGRVSAGQIPTDQVAAEIQSWSPQMAVYVKPRGGFGRAYMMLISPFRHWIVYPAMMRAVEQAWPAYQARVLAQAKSDSASPAAPEARQGE